MAKKQARKQNTNITYVTNEIDYDKLAEAIEKTHQKLDQTKVETKEDNNKNITNTLAYFCFLFLRFSTIFFLLLAIVVFLVLLEVTIIELVWDTPIRIVSNSIVCFAFLFVIGVILFYAIMLWKAASEVLSERDKNFIVALFSSYICVASLIVSLVALFK